MSAFQVSKGHIDRLVALALCGPKDTDGYRWIPIAWWAGEPRTALRESTNYEDYRRRLDAIRREVTVDNCNVVGAMLTRANLHSINARYPNTVDNPGDIPGEAMSAFVPYRFPAAMRAVRALRPLLAEALRAIACYEYQSCEADDWLDSEAYDFCDSLRKALCGVVSRAATRGWDDWDRVPAATAEGR